MLLPKLEEKRQSPRYALKQLAMIKPENGTPARYCTVLDVSDSGVRLDVRGIDIPDEFVLFFSGASPARDGKYKVVWRLEQKVGAKLVGEH
jgi:hypothetical protein